MKGVLVITNKERFLSICENIKRDGIENLIKWLEKSDFFTAPASRMYHGDYEGGLVEHSLNVYNELKRLLLVYPEINADEETIAIISLFHDLCKVNFYGTEKRNRKNSEGKWEAYDSYTVKEKLRFGGHGSKSMFITQNVLERKRTQLLFCKEKMDLSVKTITSTIDLLNSTSKEMETTIAEIEQYEKELSATKADFCAKKERNDKVIKNFKALLNIE